MPLFQGSSGSKTCPLGLLAGGMEEGTVTIYNPFHVIQGNRALTSISAAHNHKSKITAMEFQSNAAKGIFLATADEGQKLWTVHDALCKDVDSHFIPNHIIDHDVPTPFSLLYISLNLHSKRLQNA